MKPRPTPHRIRKTIKWGGAVVTVLLVVVWVGSGSWWVYAQAPNRVFVELVRGYFCAGRVSLREDPTGSSRFESGSHPFGFTSLPYHEIVVAGEWVGVPLWMPVLPSSMLSIYAWRLDTLARRRARLNFCPKCNYDRTGLALDAKCPECGSLPS